MSIAIPNDLFDHELERRVLARLFYRSYQPVMVPFSWLTEDDFCHADHKALFRASKECRMSDAFCWTDEFRAPTELAELYADILLREKSLDDEGGDREQDVRQLHDLANRRLLVGLAAGLFRDAGNLNLPLEVVLSEAERRTLSVATTVANRKKLRPD